ncbi:MAG TPA: sugar phosphate isomerase/epimerase [Terracidiphilus sp.]|nr:sugar phosphate isomerase/epimerase [Terracidiphilus sp.]
MKSNLSRRNFVQSGALMAAACVTSGATPAIAEALKETGKPCPIKLGICSYTFRNFTRAQMIGFMKELNLTDLNVKDAKDHLPMDPAQEDQALADYKAAGIKLHAAGAIYFPSSDEKDIRGKFEYAKRAGIDVIVAGDPTPESLKWIERFVKEYDIKIAIHNHGPEDKFFPSPFDVLKAIKDMDPRIGFCIDVGHAVRANANVVEAIHATGKRLYDMHVKDLANYTSRESQVAVGEGVLPFREIFQALAEIKYPGYVDLEYEIHGDNPMPGVIESFAYMRGVLTGMGYLTHA